MLVSAENVRYASAEEARLQELDRGQDTNETTLTSARWSNHPRTRSRYHEVIMLSLIGLKCGLGSGSVVVTATHYHDGR